MKDKIRVLHRCLALLLCIVMVTALLPEMTVSAALDTPVVSAAKSGSAIKVSWKPVTGAAKYRVFRKGPTDANWKKLADVASTTVSYTDKNVANGKTYTYTVRCLSKDGKTYTSSYNAAGAKVTYWNQATPSLTVTVVENGIKISWNSVGSALYRVFRDEGSGWKKVGDTSATSYVDISVSPGKTYKYTVRGMSADKKAYTSYYDTVGKSITFALDFKITSLVPVKGGVEITWTKISGVTGYTVHRWTGQDWHQINSGTISANTFTDLGQDITDHIGLYNGETYTYRVRYTVGTTEKVTPDASITYFETPELLDISQDNGSFTIKWKAVPGVSLYRVFRSENPNDPPFSAADLTQYPWEKQADVSATSYTDTKVTSGQKYHYTVRCLSADGTKYLSGYDKNGIHSDYIGKPTLISTSVENDGVHFKFNKVGSIDTYKIYRKTGSTTWQELPTAYSYSGDGGKNDVCDFVDSNVNSGQIYYYTAACMDGGAVVSAKDENGLSVIPRSAPVKKGAPTIGKNSITVTWYGIDGVTKYRVFRRDASGTVWKQMGDVAGSKDGVTFTDTTVVNQGSYVYTVRCLAENGSYASGFRENPPDAPSAKFYNTPVLSSAVVVSKVSSGNGTIKVNWQPVEGIKDYRVYRRHQRKDGTWSNWIQVGDVSSATSYEDTPPASNFLYKYTVRCLDSGSLVSYYDGNGVSAYFLMTPQPASPGAITAKGAITVRWKAVDGATGYKVYRKVPGGNWTCIKTVSGYTTLTYKDTYKIVSGQPYIYTVRAIHGNYISGYLDNAITVTAP